MASDLTSEESQSKAISFFESGVFEHPAKTHVSNIFLKYRETPFRSLKKMHNMSPRFLT